MERLFDTAIEVIFACRGGCGMSQVGRTTDADRVVLELVFVRLLSSGELYWQCRAETGFSRDLFAVRRLFESEFAVDIVFAYYSGLTKTSTALPRLISKSCRFCGCGYGPIGSFLVLFVLSAASPSCSCFLFDPWPLRWIVCCGGLTDEDGLNRTILSFWPIRPSL